MTPDTEFTTRDICLLSSDVIDQIAAGEVVERPAHLVKELVENAIDAGASSIEVEYDQGGRCVRVTDDGRGICAAQLKLAIARHATSKISRPDDLYRLTTFGFRGEALASIAAVSRFSMQSRPMHAETAHRVVSEFGRLSDAEPVGGNHGTTVLVEELFSNIPARLKFLKSEAGENAQIKSTLKALALANEKIEFRIRTKGKLEQVWKRSESFLDRAKQVLDLPKLYASEFDYNGYRAEAAFASPHDVMGNSRSIWIFVQGRWVQDRSLQHAVIEAYRGLLMHGEFPVAAVRLLAPPDDLDVNIHPTKSQVKFRDSQPAFRAVNRALREGLERAPWLITGAQTEIARSPQDLQVGEPRVISSARASDSGDPNSYRDGIRAAAEANASRKMTVAELTRPYQSTRVPRGPFNTADGGLAAAGTPDLSNLALGDSSHDAMTPLIHLAQEIVPAWVASEGSLATSPLHSLGRFEAPEFNTVVFKQKSDHVEVGALDGDGREAKLRSTHDIAGEWNSSPTNLAAATLAAPSSIQAAGAKPVGTGAWSRLQVLGQAHLTYILAQDNERLVMVDQHAAHERVAYERLMRAWLSGNVDVQPLLLPIAIELEPDGAEALLNCAPELERLGVQLDQTGPQSVAICAMPVAIKEKALVKALQALAREIVDRGGSFALERKISDLCATMACHSVVRAGQALSLEQMRNLLLQMDEFPLSSFCPHGRPVSVDYPFAKLERDFGRIV